MLLTWTPRAWADYLHWQEHDQALLSKINHLLRECLRTPFAGTGKPEPLRGNLARHWSRRISAEHRLVYRVEGEHLVVVACRYHYEK